MVYELYTNKATVVAHCGLMINAGSRDEEAHQQGIAHFIEHTIFKGNQKKKGIPYIGAEWKM